MLGLNDSPQGEPPNGDIQERIRVLQEQVETAVSLASRAERLAVDMQSRISMLEARIPKLPDPEPVTLSAAKAGEVLGMKPEGIIALVKAGLLPGHQAKGRTGYTILQSDVEAFKAKHTGT